MDFGVLGPIAAWQDGKSVPVGGPRQRCVLGVLLVELGKEVTVERLIDLLWDGDPPRTARSIIQVQVSHLRRSFPGLIQTTAGGYLAQTDPDQVDLHRFRNLAARAQERGATEEAAALWEEALACWRGQPFSGTGSELLWYTVCQPLLEERWAAVAAWAEVDFALGNHVELAARLTPLVRKDPLRERLHFLLISALYRSGQRLTALSTFHEVRKALAEELGVDPGRDVMELYERMLHDHDTDPAAEAAREEPAETASPPGKAETASPGLSDGQPARNDLPRDIPDFTGREADLDRILEIGARGEERAEVCVITGPGGTGKTTLAIHAAHRLADRYPDAQLFVDLYGHTVDQEPVTARTALASLLRAIGVDPEALPDDTDERAALWRASLAGKRVLVVLDNAATSRQVLPLLSAAAGSLTIVTSRHDLAGLSGTRYVALGMLDTETSVDFFTTVLGAERVGREPDAARRVVALCGGLPLALRIVAGRMLSRPRWTFRHVEERLGQQHRRFHELRIEGQSVEAVFELSFQSLNAEQRETFLRLGLMIGGSVDLYGAAALIDRDPPDADDLIQELVSVCLVDEQGVDLYRFHDLIGAYARHRAFQELDEEEIAESRRRLGAYYLRAAQRATEWLGPRAHDYEVGEAADSRYREEWRSRSEAVDWFDKHRENLASMVSHYAESRQGRNAWQLAHALWRFYAVHGQTELWLSTHEQALDASRADNDDMGSAVTLVGLGIAHCLSGRLESALSLLEEAREIFVRLGDEAGEIRVFANLAVVYERMGRYEESAAALDRTIAYAVATGDQALEALQRTNLGGLHQAMGNLEEAVRHCEAVLRIQVEPGSMATHASALRTLGEVNTRRGDYATAREQLERALRLFLDMGDTTGEIYTRNNLGCVLRETGDIEGALAAHRLALELGEKTAQRSAEAEVLNDLAVTYARAGRYIEARSSHEEALDLARDRNERYAEAKALAGLAALPASTVPADEARSLLSEAAEIFAELGVPEAQEAAGELKRREG
ncbi:AfsR/SARP family transcriptional regulator [Marinactinospora thermotolerans]|uniref:AfsR/SARP family transcriptional regulator n=1 Tax=Marinactinospora thermotolerans TaxID=531310 RepID=UPI001F17AD2E|nr:tetratricopeptide repeat protein [Marinactinospora thermotolerans]